MTEERASGLSVTLQDGSLVVQSGGAFPLEAGPGKWVARALDDKRMIVSTEEGRLIAGEAEGVASCTVRVFKDFLLGLHHAGWSGMLSIDTGYGVKRRFEKVRSL